MAEAEDTAQAILFNYRSYLLSQAEDIYEFLKRLSDEEIFDWKSFRRIRRRHGSQSDFAEMIGVSQATIGNWERGATYPNAAYRQSIRAATEIVLDKLQSRLRSINTKESIDINPIEAKEQLNTSILKAALTDFSFDAAKNVVVAVPFGADSSIVNIDEIERDRKNLLESLSEQAGMIAEGLQSGANTETDSLISYLAKYSQQCVRDTPNPRLLHRLGETIARRTNDQDVRAALSGWDDEAIDGFNRDHLELMRLYFRAALARAQEVEAAFVQDEAGEPDAQQFYAVADKIDEVRNADGAPFVHEDIPTLLRDIAKEIRDLKESENFTFDEKRRLVLARRRREAIKNGSIYVGRFLFFTSLFVALTPAVNLSAIGSLASIVGLFEAAAPGTIRKTYDKLREYFPILPSLPRVK